MPVSKKRWAVGIVGALILGGVLVWLLLPKLGNAPTETSVVKQPVVATTTPARETKRVVGTSVEGRAIESYRYGTGDTRVLFVGGIHGGYEWNSTLLAYRFIDYIEANPSVIPANLTVEIIPSANPDGLFDVIKKEGRFELTDVPADEGPLGTGRFNARGVDLNRNFACKWQPTSMWRGNVVSAGTAAFSEPEAVAVRDFVLERTPAAVVFWHSQSNAVYASECENGILAGTRTLMNTYATASGYPAVDVFGAYPVTGDAEGWLASIGIPAVTVELATHKTIEWEKNLAGFAAMMKLYGSL
jgi:predicted deacylase